MGKFRVSSLRHGITVPTTLITISDELIE